VRLFGRRGLLRLFGHTEPSRPSPALWTPSSGCPLLIGVPAHPWLDTLKPRQPIEGTWTREGAARRRLANPRFVEGRVGATQVPVGAYPSFHILGGAPGSLGGVQVVLGVSRSWVGYPDLRGSCLLGGCPIPRSNSPWGGCSSPSPKPQPQPEPGGCPSPGQWVGYPDLRGSCLLDGYPIPRSNSPWGGCSSPSPKPQPEPGPSGPVWVSKPGPVGVHARASGSRRGPQAQAEGGDPAREG
jgi:hypothetical protein